MEELQAGRPTARTPGQCSRGLRGERCCVHRPEQLFHFPGTESEILTVELKQLAGDEHPRSVDARWASAAQDHPDLPRPEFQEAFQRPLGRRTGDLMEIVDDQLHGRDRRIVQGADQIGDSAGRGRADHSWFAERGPERVPDVAGECDLVVVLSAHSIPGCGVSGRRREMAQQRGLAGAGRPKDKTE